MVVGYGVWGTIIYLKYSTFLEFSVINQFYFGLICDRWLDFAQWYQDEETELGLIWNILQIHISYIIGEYQHLESKISYRYVLGAQKTRIGCSDDLFFYLGRYLGFFLACQSFGFP